MSDGSEGRVDCIRREQERKRERERRGAKRPGPETDYLFY